MYTVKKVHNVMFAESLMFHWKLALIPFLNHTFPLIFIQHFRKPFFPGEGLIRLLYSGVQTLFFSGEQTYFILMYKLLFFLVYKLFLFWCTHFCFNLFESIPSEVCKLKVREDWSSSKVGILYNVRGDVG